MKKVINGKVYDTAKAERLAGWSNGCSTTDFGYCEETLYRKRTGEMFLHGEGGAASKYSECNGNEWGWGEKIVPLSYEAARKWAEDHIAADRYESIFGEVDEEDDDTRVSITVYLPASKVERAKREAAKRGMGLSAYIESLI